LIKVRPIEKRGLGCLLDPQVLWWLEVVAEDGDDLLDLVIAVLVHEEIEGLVQVE